ncbi:uncharacterized protein YALI1_F30416g [Yarrowia lipolytica]|uniref:Uncharacterized protein n=1 Tax=Yarrowia lipolytica TaxID=4952 RepID=A0A1D8NPN4_YARLL|nr:hypothetical protein YALI1_F30416g [Yarrowia lipolytica]
MSCLARGAPKTLTCPNGLSDIAITRYRLNKTDHPTTTMSCATLAPKIDKTPTIIRKGQVPVDQEPRNRSLPWEVIAAIT